MLNLRFTNQFKKDYALLKRRGYTMSELDKVIAMLREEKPLPPEYEDHPLQGNWKGHRDCHIRGNWVLIYRIDEAELILEASRTGTHSDLFKK